ncbi:LysR family transcriptional regulator [Pantoea sp.]|uniref:LysR family transcriptional regulator n=1 Tax=Pantoea sp. TaxID=69393 RepID=UPI0028A9F1D7|nr:LysR family transcriptional regulator [Pantoea sp.]
MNRRNANDLLAFLTIAREQSFTKAANKLGVSSSALSHTIRALEERLGLRLLTRTTRNVSATEAGERLLSSLGPLFDEIDHQIDALSALRDKPSGTVRLTCTDHVSQFILRDRIAGVIKQYPELKIEILLDYGLTNIVGDRIDAGIRQGELISKDMIAVRISPDWRFALVGSPDYFKKYPEPDTPYDLTRHNCAGLRLTSSGTLWAWDFQQDGKEFSVKVDGQLSYNSIMPGFDAALDGICLAYVPYDMAKEHIDSGALREVLSEYSLRCLGFHLYYPNRRQATPAFSAVVDALRYTEPSLNATVKRKTV